MVGRESYFLCGMPIKAWAVETPGPGSLGRGNFRDDGYAVLVGGSD